MTPSDTCTHILRLEQVAKREVIGRHLLFELVLSGGDLGECVMSFLAGKKGKNWDDANAAAAAGQTVAA